MIDTGKVADRRQLHFDNAEQLMADVERVAASDRAGTLRRTGNWTTGQVFGHLAAWIDYSYDGYPPELKPPWFIKVILRMMKKRFMRGPLKAGVKIPKIEGGTLGIEPFSLDEGLARFNKAWDRLRRSPPTVPNIIFGELTHQECMTGHLRHAELHLSFLHPS